jgi:nicotinamidase/pyrazinamidase
MHNAGHPIMKKSIIVVVSMLALCIVILVVNYVVVDLLQSQVSEGRPITQTGTKREALLVIDVQEGITGKAATSDVFVKQSEELLGVVNRLVDSSAMHNIPVIYVKNEISNPLINILNSSLAIGSPGAELDSRLRMVSAYVINKDKGDAFSNPLLDSILTSRDVNTLVFTGLDLARCVKSTILAAANRHYTICLISDAVITQDPDSLKHDMLEKFKQRGCEVMSSEEYLQKLRKENSGAMSE